ncbi:hypothetical protein LLID5_19410 [Lactococcus lactis]|nr:hypothetical protein LLID5_19410 [Lactococcus lactis]
MTETNTVKIGTLGTYIITYTATDNTGNKATATRNVVVRDTTDPTLTVNPATVTIATGANYDLMTGVSAKDNYNVAADIKISYSPTSFDNTKPGTYTITYTATDTSGNVSESKTRKITVKDSTAPVISLKGAASMTVEAGATFTDPDATATDTVDGNVAVSSNSSATNPNMKVPGTYTITYTATDKSGNTATKTRTAVVKDTTPPKITLNGDNPVYVEKGTKFTDPGAAADIVDGTDAVSASGTVDVNTVETYTITYTATDKAGNKATISRNVIVRDTTAPTGSVSYSTTNPTNKDVIATITTNGPITTPCGWTKVDDTHYTKDFANNYSGTVQICDSLNNCSAVAISVANIDKIAPTATIVYSPTTPTNGSVLATMTVSESAQTPSGWTKVSATKFTKNFGNNGSGNVQVCDLVGNCSTVAYSISNIDTSKPVITINGANPLHVEASKTSSFTDSFGATATDNSGVSIKIIESNNVKESVPGSYSEVYSATDAAGNTATATRAITVSDTTKPTINVSPTAITAKQGTDIDLMSGVSATDNFSTANITETSSSSFANSTVGIYTITYTATDTAGNKATAKRTITITDGIAPTATISYSTTALTNKDIVATLTTDEPITTPDGWAKIDDTHYSRNFANNYSGNQQFCDLNKNCSLIQINIENIDKIPTKLTVSYSTTDQTTDSVVATITSDEPVSAPTDWTQISPTSYQKTFAKNYSDTITFTDLARNISTINVSVQNIYDPEEPGYVPDGKNPPSLSEKTPSAPQTGTFLLGFSAVFAIVGATIIFAKITKKKQRNN